MTPAGIEPATFRFVVQQLNHCATTVPPISTGRWTNIRSQYQKINVSLPYHTKPVFAKLTSLQSPSSWSNKQQTTNVNTKTIMSMRRSWSVICFPCKLQHPHYRDIQVIQFPLIKIFNTKEYKKMSQKYL